MTRTEFNAAIDAVIKNNTSGSDFIEPSEVNTLLKGLVTELYNLLENSSSAFTDTLLNAAPSYTTEEAATTALGSGKLFRYSSSSTTGFAGLFAVTP